MTWAAQPANVGPGAPPTAGSSHRRTGGWWLTAFVLLLAAAASFGFGLRGGQRSLAGPLYTTPLRTPPKVVNPAARSVPVSLSVPAIGINSPLSELGLNPDHTIQVPSDFHEPGWYEYGPSPGQRGSAIILGHVDSYQGPAVFYKLRDLKPGDHVDVRLADGVVTHFEVRQIAQYKKADFPSLLVYGSHGFSGLQLVTCGGIFDAHTGHYLSNVVVYTSLVSATRP